MPLYEMQQRMVQDLFLAQDCEPDHNAASYIRSTLRLNAADRISIYRRSYWHRLIDSFYEDFPGLQALLGEAAFERLAQSYLKAHPSRSFSLRDLGQFLERWVCENRTVLGSKYLICLDMVRLEWADIEAFDGAMLQASSIEELAEAGSHSRFTLQPHLRLLHLKYPVDNVRLISKRSPVDVHIAVSEARRYEGPAIYLAVYRFNLSVYYLRLSKEEWAILTHLQKGCTLEEAIHAGFQDSILTIEDQAKALTESFKRFAQLEFFGQQESSQNH